MIVLVVEVLIQILIWQTTVWFMERNVYNRVMERLSRYSGEQNGVEVPVDGTNTNSENDEDKGCRRREDPIADSIWKKKKEL